MYNFKEWSSLDQTLIKIKHNREMVGKICASMKLTPPCTPLPQYNKALDKNKVIREAFTLLLIYSLKKFFELTKL